MSNNEMSSTSIPKLLLKFSAPAVIALLVNALYNIVDGMFVGKGVGDLALAGVSVGFPIITTVIAFIMLIAMGATALISIYLGKKEKENAEKILGNAFILLIIISIPISVFGLIFTEEIVKLFGTTENVLPYAVDYMKIMFIGTIFLALSTGVNTFIRAEGNPKTAMFTMLIGAITNIFLDYLFIYVFKWGIKGAALATVTSYFVSSIWVISYFLTKRSILKLKIINFKIQSSIVFEMLKLGTPTFFLQITTSIQQLVLNRSLAIYGGDHGLAAIGVIMNVSTFLIMPAMGIGQGAQPIIGYNKGANLNERVKDTLKYSLIYATVVVTFGYLLVTIFPKQIFSLFTNDTNLLSTGSQAMSIFFKFLPVVGIQMITANYFQATGKPNQSTMIGLSRQVFFFIPLLLILPKFYNLNGVWYSAPFSDLLAFLFSVIFLYVEFQILNKDNNKISINNIS